MAGGREDVYCTLLMSDSYLPGACVLAHSLRDSGTTKKLAVLITTDTLLESTLRELNAVYDYVIPVDKIATSNIDNLVRLDRLDLRFAFTKIALWRQMQFRKIVYLDADVVALRAPDELFDLDVAFAAAPDIGWPDCFNTGVMVLKPSMSDYWSLQTLAASGASFDGADQGLLNEYYGNRPWHRLSFAYNCTPSSSYQYEPAFRQFRSSINMVHFIGKDKPWYQGRQAIDQQGSSVYKELLGRWWAVYDRHYKVPQTSAMGQLNPAVKNVSQYVRGEQTQSAFGWAASGAPPQSFEGNSPSYTHSAGFSAPGFSAPAPAPPLQLPTYHRQGPPETAAPQVPSEPPVSLASAGDTPQTSGQSSGEVGQSSGQQDIPQPPPTTERQRRFSAPKNEWDATRSEPPPTSKPEAQSFPTDHYEMSRETQLFSPPKSYPEPPKDMWYKVPEIQPAIYEKPKPIFPWESGEAAKARAAPTRVFAEDYLREPEPEPEPRTLPEPQPEVVNPENIVNSGVPATPAAPDVPMTASDPWQAFTRTNAWDDDVSIDRYVRALKKSQARRGNIQVLHHTANEGSTSETQESATGSSGSTTPPQGRRESILLTDFPSEIERPSLPVTPAPLRRTNFWPTDKDNNEQAEQLVAAEGVPEQKDWVCPNCGYTCSLPAVSLSTIGAPTSAASSAVVRTPTSKREIVYSPARDVPERPFSPFSVIASQTRPRSVGGRASPHLNQGRTTLAPAADFFKKNPSERLEELRRSSIVATADLANLSTSDTKIPARQHPESAVSAKAPEFRNLEETFSGARTQERIEGASSELARGIDPDDQSGQGKISREEVADSKKAWNAGFGLFNQDEASEEMQEPIEEPTKEKSEETGGLAVGKISGDESTEEQMTQSKAAVENQGSNAGFGLFDEKETNTTVSEGVDGATDSGQTIPGSFPDEEDTTNMEKVEPVGAEPSIPGSFPDDEGTGDASNDISEVGTEVKTSGDLSSQVTTKETLAEESEIEKQQDLPSVSTSGEKETSQINADENASKDLTLGTITDETSRAPSQSDTQQDLFESSTTDVSKLEGVTSEAAQEISRAGVEESAPSGSKVENEASDIAKDVSTIGAEQLDSRVVDIEPETSVVSQDNTSVGAERSAFSGSEADEPTSEVSKEVPQTTTGQTSSSASEESAGNISKEKPQIGVEQTTGSSLEDTSTGASKDLSQTVVEETGESNLEGTTAAGASKDISLLGEEGTSSSTLAGTTSSVSKDVSQIGSEQTVGSASEGVTATGTSMGVSETDLGLISGSSLDGTTTEVAKEVSSTSNVPSSEYVSEGKTSDIFQSGFEQASDSTSKEVTSGVTKEVSETGAQPTSDFSVEGKSGNVLQDLDTSNTGISTSGGSTSDQKVFELSQGLVGAGDQQSTDIGSSTEDKTSDLSQGSYKSGTGMSTSSRSAFDQKAFESSEGVSGFGKQQSTTIGSGFEGTTSDVSQGLSQSGTGVSTSDGSAFATKTGDLSLGSQSTSTGYRSGGQTADLSQGMYQSGTGFSSTGGYAFGENTRDVSRGLQTTSTSSTSGGNLDESWQRSFETPAVTELTSKTKYIEPVSSISTVKTTSSSSQISRTGSPITIVRYTPTGIVTEAYDQSSFASTEIAIENQPWIHASSSSFRDETTTSSSTSTSAARASASTGGAAITQARPASGDFFHKITAAQWAFDVNPDRADTGEIVGATVPSSMLSGMRQAVQEATEGRTIGSSSSAAGTESETERFRSSGTKRTTTTYTTTTTTTTTSGTGTRTQTQQRESRGFGADMDEYDIA